MPRFGITHKKMRLKTPHLFYIDSPCINNLDTRLPQNYNDVNYLKLKFQKQKQKDKTMIIKCPGCGSALKFNPETGKMECAYCGNSYEPGEVNEREYMECNIYTCSSCGAELMVNDKEVSSFCSYCGQPTIVFSRVSKELKPDLVIPFSITKEDAEARIRKSLSKNPLIPKDIQNFDTERIRGIYMPFWVYDVDYEGKSIIRAAHGSSKNKYWSNHYRHGRCRFENMIADASERFSDESSQRLEPFDFSATEEFTPQYLSGFYADRSDVDSTNTEKIIEDRATGYYEKDIIKTVSGSEKYVSDSWHSVNISKPRYAMLPVWFLTFLREGKPFTFLVNGQTGKVVGAVPYRKSMAGALIGILGVILSFVACLLTMAIFSDGEANVKTILFFIIIAIAMFVGGKSIFKKIRISNELTNSDVLNTMVKNREEEQ